MLSWTVWELVELQLGASSSSLGDEVMVQHRRAGPPAETVE